MELVCVFKLSKAKCVGKVHDAHGDGRLKSNTHTHTFLPLCGVDIDSYDPLGSGSLASHNDSQTNGTATKDSCVGANLDLSCV